MLQILNDENYEEKIKEGVNILYFSASWCQPCKRLAPIIEEVASERDDVNIYKIDAEENDKATTQFTVRSIPTIFVIKDGVVVNRENGILPKEAINDLIDKAF